MLVEERLESCSVAVQTENGGHMYRLRKLEKPRKRILPQSLQEATQPP